MTIGELLSAIEKIAPPNLAMHEDAIGLQVGSKSSQVQTCAVSLDASAAALDFALKNQAQALVTHHALIYHPLRSLAGDSAQLQAVRKAIVNGIAVITAHTNWDAADGGINDTLVQLFNLHSTESFGEHAPQAGFKLVSFAPNDQVDKILDALSDLGCGQIGLYRRCAFLSNGLGTFEPLPGSNPLIGQVGRREQTEEVRFEIFVPEQKRRAAELALRQTHPYDEPAFDFYPLSIQSAKIGRAGNLPERMTLDEIGKLASKTLRATVRLFGSEKRIVSRLGVIGGAGGHYWMSAKAAGCDALLTGEVRHHEAAAASESGFALIEAGHYATEQPGMQTLRDRLAETLPEVRFLLFEPQEGEAGRPR